jgi:hypothetical protein
MADQKPAVAAGASAAPLPGPPPVRRAGLRRWLRRLRILLMLSPLLAAAVIALYLAVALHYSYSSGDRAGYVQKFSKKGWVCKTWEGELALVSLPGALPEVFAFSVRDEAVAAEINKHLGERVALTYEQHKGLPSCFGETEYFAVAVRRVQQ